MREAGRADKHRVEASSEEHLRGALRGSPSQPRVKLCLAWLHRAVCTVCIVLVPSDHDMTAVPVYLQAAAWRGTVAMNTRVLPRIILQRTLSRSLRGTDVPYRKM